MSADLADMQIINKFNKGIRFLLFVIDIFSKYTWVIPLTDEKGITITNTFQKFLKESNRKPSKTWGDKRSEFYNRSMKSFLQNNNIEVYSKHNEGKSVIAERFIGTLKNKIYKYMTSISKNVYIHKLENMAKAKSNTYINSSQEINDKDLRFKIHDIVRVSKYKKDFRKRLCSILV